MVASNDNAWPGVGTEPRPWERDPDVAASRRALRATHGPYFASVPPLIADLDAVLPPDVAAAADDATRELSRFDAELGHVATPLPSILLRTESASSSEVERITASARQVALAELDASTSENARLVVANARAMQAAISLAEHVDTAAILRMHEALLGASQPSIVGSWRDEQVWVGGDAVAPHRASFIPPHHDRVAALMNDLALYLRRTDVPALTHIALAHAQFETIHPFPDGNGRTGRALAQAMLRADDVTRNVTVPISAGLLGDVPGYVDALTTYRAGDPSRIVEVFADSAFRAITNGRRLAADLARLDDEWATRVPARAGAAVHALRGALQAHPVVSVELIARLLGVSFQTANAAIDRFERASVLRLVSGRRRNRLWQTDDVLRALDDFAERARRGRP